MLYRLVRLTRAQCLALGATATLLAMVVALAGVAMGPRTHPSVHYDIRVVAAINQISTTVGVSDSDLYWKAGDAAYVAQSLDRMKSVGVKDLRMIIPWGTIETSKGTYDWSAIDNIVSAANDRGMSVLGILGTTPLWARPSSNLFDFYVPPNNPQDFGNFAKTVAARYAGKVSAYEIWNEPNAALSYRPSPDPTGYTALLKAGYTGVKAGDSKASVIGGVVGSTITIGTALLNPVDFVRGMYAAGARGYFDALSFHPYQPTTPFSQGGYMAQSPINQVAAIYGLMSANGDAKKQIWATEYGQASGTSSEATQASYVKDFLDSWAKLSYAGPSYVYTLNDRDSDNTWDPEASFGLFRENGTLKPVGQIIKDWITAHPATSTPTPPTTTTPTTPTDPFAALAAALQKAVQAWLSALASMFGIKTNTATVTTQSAATVAAATTPNILTQQLSATSPATTSSLASARIASAGGSSVSATVPSTGTSSSDVSTANTAATSAAASKSSSPSPQPSSPQPSSPSAAVNDSSRASVRATSPSLTATPPAVTTSAPEVPDPTSESASNQSDPNQSDPNQSGSDQGSNSAPSGSTPNGSSASNNTPSGPKVSSGNGGVASAATVS